MFLFNNFEKYLRVDLYKRICSLIILSFDKSISISIILKKSQLKFNKTKITFWISFCFKLISLALLLRLILTKLLYSLSLKLSESNIFFFLRAALLLIINFIFFIVCNFLFSINISIGISKFLSVLFSLNSYITLVLFKDGWRFFDFDSVFFLDKLSKFAALFLIIFGDDINLLIT